MKAYTVKLEINYLERLHKLCDIHIPSALWSFKFISEVFCRIFITKQMKNRSYTVHSCFILFSFRNKHVYREASQIRNKSSSKRVCFTGQETRSRLQRTQWNSTLETPKHLHDSRQRHNSAEQSTRRRDR